ncbi:hypothetical protein H4582DRAFT_1016710 [Lactarius indigo]|nr:hypothetical protein H4582DRAFT_1016710 [Lactarius indigo]
MCVANQGDALSVELLLEHDANPHSRDDADFTLMHRAVVRGNMFCFADGLRDAPRGS